MILLGLILACGSARAQGVGASGDIRGTISDPSGAVIVGKRIASAESADRVNWHSVAVSGSRRQYRFDRTSARARTTMTAAVQGVPVRKLAESAAITVGSTTVIDIGMDQQSGFAGTKVLVTAAPPVVETERGSEANTLTEQYITDPPHRPPRLPHVHSSVLPGRVEFHPAGGQFQDFRVKQTPQSGLSFYGSNGRGNSVTVDGGEALDDSGGVRTTVSQDAVQEFQVNRSNYSADLGGASGASINIVTKSGTNDFHGSLFSYFRNSALDARDPFAFSSALAPDPTFGNFQLRFHRCADQEQPQPLPIRRPAAWPPHPQRTRPSCSSRFEGLLQNSENSVPLLTSSSIFQSRTESGWPQRTRSRTTDPRARAAGDRHGSCHESLEIPAVPCINNPNGTTTFPTAQTQCVSALRGVDG